MGEVMASFIRHTGQGLPLRQRAALVAGMMRDGQKRFEHVAATQCEAAMSLAERLLQSPGVVDGLAQTLERWDGKGGPAKLKGDQLGRPMRVLAVAHDAEVFERVGGLEACQAAIHKRRGSAYDPEIADTFLGVAGDVIGEPMNGSLWDEALDAEPEPKVRISDARIDDLARAFADFVDLKSPYTTGHSTAVAALAETAAATSGEDAVVVRRAGLFHDIGRVAVPNGIWEKAGPLSTAEWERVRLHAYHGERILTRAAALTVVAALASTHHERLDGSGYHRGSQAGQLSPAARIVEAADAYQAMTQERPHRPAMSPDDAARELRAQVESGLLDRAAAEAVLEASGHERTRTRAQLPAGLSERELDVLRLICLGSTNRQMAANLNIAEKTVGHHIEHIYNKIGRSTRAGAALFAMENGLIS
jgi:putative nucleotidyltransferase with HDIG domain